MFKVVIFIFLSKINQIVYFVKFSTSYLGLGTNLGDRSRNLEIAIQRVVEWPCELIRQSSVYETEAWGIVEQPCY